jgi:AAHS family benzoate transporter-like MFS transporter
MTTAITRTPEQDARRRSTVAWVVGLAFVGLVFDGYDLVVYGAVLSTFLRDPTQIGQVTPAVGGALGSYALVGVLVGALLAGTISDVLGRRKVMLLAYAWFSVGMAVTALMTSTTGFGLMRFVTGLGVGALVATTGAIVSEFAPPGKKNLCNAIVYCGVPFGSLLAALLAILLLAGIGWRGMFLIGALPIVTLLPLAFFKMPESPTWLLSRGRVDEARALAERTGVPLDEAAAAASSATGKQERAGFAGLFTGGNALPALLLGFMSVTGLLLVYALNTWLPELMRRAGFSTQGSLAFLLVLNGGAVIGALIGSRIADRFGPKPVVASCFLIGAISIAIITFSLPIGILLFFIAIVGLGTSGTQTLLFGFVANYFSTKVRGAAVAWCAGFGRLGGVGGPLLGGLLIAAGLALNSIFYILAALALLGMVLTLLVPVRRTQDLTATTIEPSVIAGEDVARSGRTGPTA